MSQVNPVSGTRFCFHTQEGALAAIAVDHPGFTASILLQGAQLVRFSPRGENNWLWLSEEESFTPGRAIRGGVPICWPWFGDPDRNPSAVRQHIGTDLAHGLARQSVWQLQSIEELPDSVTVNLALESAQFPTDTWRARATLSARFQFTAETMAISLETHNTGNQALHLTQALHSYFPTPDIQQTQVHGLDGQSYTDALDHWQKKSQVGPVAFQGETDRIYSVAGPMTLVTPTTRLRLQQTSASAVIWNPWQEKAKRLSNFAVDAWQRMFCVETANALDDSVRLEAGTRHTMALEIRRAQ